MYNVINATVPDWGQCQDTVRVCTRRAENGEVRSLIKGIIVADCSRPNTTNSNNKNNYRDDCYAKTFKNHFT